MGFQHYQIDEQIKQLAEFSAQAASIGRNRGIRSQTIAYKGMRPADTYRGARRNAFRAQCQTWPQLRTARRQLGLGRPALDRLRHMSALINPGPPKPPPASTIPRFIQGLPKLQRLDGLGSFDLECLAKAKARRETRNAKRAALAQSQRRAA